MPRYFFDLEGEPPDDTGFVLPDIDAAQRAVQMSLPHLLAERGKRSTSLSVMMTVRDECDRAVLSVTLSVSIRRPAVDASRVHPRSARASNAAARQSES